MTLRILLLLNLFVCAVASAGTIVGCGPWSGGVTSDSAVVVAVLTQNDYGTNLEYSTTPDFASSTMIAPVPPAEPLRKKVLRFELKELQPSTRYYYRIVHEENAPLRIYPDATDGGEFKTFPAPGRTSFSFAFSSCASTGSINQVFTAIKYHAPAFYMNIGDLHY